MLHYCVPIPIPISRVSAIAISIPISRVPPIAIPSVPVIGFARMRCLGGMDCLNRAPIVRLLRLWLETDKAKFGKLSVQGRTGGTGR